VTEGIGLRNRIGKKLFFFKQTAHLFFFWEGYCFLGVLFSFWGDFFNLIAHKSVLTAYN